MRVTETLLPGVKIIEPDVFGDERGFFFENYSTVKLAGLGITDVFIQDNHSLSKKAGTLRGLHFQLNPHAQSKIIRCSRGRILDVAVDFRAGSPTYREWISVELSAENFRQLYIPSGFAHGFLTLTGDTEVQYKASMYYAPEYDRCVLWNDPAIGIEWGISNPILSAKDSSAPLLEDSDNNYKWESGI